MQKDSEQRQPAPATDPVQDRSSPTTGRQGLPSDKRPRSLMGHLSRMPAWRRTVAIVASIIAVGSVLHSILGYFSLYSVVAEHWGGQSSSRVSHSSVAAAPLLLIAPIKAASLGKEAELFAHGLSDELIAGLARFPTLRVMGRGTSAALSPLETDHIALREKFGITHVLTGELRVPGQKYSMNLELTETRTGAVLWSERFGGALTDIVDVTDDVVRSVVGRVASEVRQADLRVIGPISKPNLSAYHLTLQARQLWQKPTRDTLPEAQQLLQQALSIDPTYAPAYAYLAFTHLTLYNNSWSPGFAKKETLEQMLSLSTKALGVNPNYGTAHGAQAIAYTYLGRHVEGQAAAREAMRLNGNDADTLGRVGQVQSFSGDHSEAIQTLKQAIALDPFGPAQWRNFLSRAYFFSGDYKAATGEAKICLERSNIEPCRETLAAAHAHLGELVEAATVWKEIDAKRPGIEPEKMVARLRSAFARQQDLEQLVSGLKTAKEAAEKGKRS